MSLKQIIWDYTEKETRNKDERNKINARIEQREKQIQRLRTRLDKLGYVSWVDEFLVPIAKAMVATMPDRYYETLGPFGVTSETAIHFYRKGVDEKHLLDDCKSITFRPTNLNKGELSLVDYAHNTHQYAKGTMGEMNGMNYPTIPMKKSIDELLDFMTQQEKKTKVAV